MHVEQKEHGDAEDVTQLICTALENLSWCKG